MLRNKQDQKIKSKLIQGVIMKNYYKTLKDAKMK